MLRHEIIEELANRYHVTLARPSSWPIEHLRSMLERAEKRGAEQCPNFHKMLVGNWQFTIQILSCDGVMRQCKVEEYVEGFVAFIKEDDDWLTNWALFPTAQKALNKAPEMRP